MKKIISIILALVIVLSLAACGRTSTEKSTAGNAGSTTAGQKDSGNKWDYGTRETEAASKGLTLDDAQVRLVVYDGTYADNGTNYLLLAYYGPQEDISYHFCNPDGSSIEDAEWPTYWKYENGWRLLETSELPAGYTADNIALSVTDYGADGEPTRIFSDFGEPLTKAEMEEIGVTYFGEKFGNFITEGSIVNLISEVCVFVGIKWYGGANVLDNDLPFDIEDFAFYAEDGRPLNECVGEEFEYIVETWGDYIAPLEISTVDGIMARFKVNDGEYSEERMAELCDLIKELNPYMAYTTEDGTEVRVENFLAGK